MQHRHIIFVAGLAAGTLAHFGCWGFAKNHCANLGGDATCADRGGFCNACEAVNDGCTEQEPPDGCYFPGGVASTGNGPSDPSLTTSGDETQGVGTQGLDGTQDGDGTGDDTMAGSDDTTGVMTPGRPFLEISDGDIFDFGDIFLDESATHSFSILNTGDGDATNMIGSPLVPPFTYAGGAYPGTSGNCGESLEAGDECTISVTFTPSELGLHSSRVEVSYGESRERASREIRGGGAGTGDNMLLNPGGEDWGFPIPSWTNRSDDIANTWESVTTVTDNNLNITSHSGSRFIAATVGLSNSEYRLHQTPDVSPWAITIDEGLMRFRFTGFARSRAIDDNTYRVRIFYRNVSGDTIGFWETGWITSSDWAFVNHSDLAPPLTRSIEVELGCVKTWGTFCDAFFDDLALRASYP